MIDIGQKHIKQQIQQKTVQEKMIMRKKKKLRIRGITAYISN